MLGVKKFLIHLFEGNPSPPNYISSSSTYAPPLPSKTLLELKMNQTPPPAQTCNQPSPSSSTPPTSSFPRAKKRKRINDRRRRGRFTGLKLTNHRRPPRKKSWSEGKGVGDAGAIFRGRPKGRKEGGVRKGEIKTVGGIPTLAQQ